MTSNTCESPKELRFLFGRNWNKFLHAIDSHRIDEAQNSLVESLGRNELKGMSFLDIGSGSGLFSLAARMLGARVTSFDYDLESVRCTETVKSNFFPKDRHWVVKSGSILDSLFLADLGKFDLVYSWGVLHHTGNMWKALENISTLVNPNGYLFISIYNDMGRMTQVWLQVKKLYNFLPKYLRWIVILATIPRLWFPTMLVDLFTRLNPLYSWNRYKSNRGMSPWHDIVDWVGGYPFEVASPEQIFAFFKTKGFQLEKLKTCSGGIGCNEFVFKLTGSTTHV